jgi:hypothetical protein
MDTVSSMNLAALSAITSNPEAVVAQYKGMRQPKLYWHNSPCTEH